MAKQTINLGTGELTGDGESIRSAFDKINDNFDENYINLENHETRLATAEGTVNNHETRITTAEQKISALEDGSVTTDIVGSVVGNDSTVLVDATSNTINLDGTISGNIIPDTDVAYDLGSATNRFRDIYLSGSTIDLGGTTLSVVDGTLQIGGVDINDVVTAAGVDYSEIQNTPNLFDGDYNSLTNKPVIPEGIVEGSNYRINIAGSDSTIIVDSDTNTVTADSITITGGFNLSGLFDYGVAASDQIVSSDIWIHNSSDPDGGIRIVANTNNLQLDSSGGAVVIGTNATQTIINGNVDFGNSGNIDFTGASTTGFAPGDIYAKNGQYLYVASASDGGTTTNVAFTYDTNISNVRQTFYGKTEFGNNGQAPIVDFTGASVTGLKVDSNSNITFETEQDPGTWSDGSIETSFYSYLLNFPTNQPAVTAPLIVGWNDYAYIQPFLPTDIGATEATQGLVKRSLELRGGDATDSREPGLLLLNGGSNSSQGLYGEVRINNVAGDVKIGNASGTTTIAGNTTVNKQLTVEESYSSTPTTKFFEIETGAGNNRLLRTGVNMSAFAQEFGPEIDLTSYRSSPANGDAGPGLVFRASTGASVNDVIATIKTEVIDTTNGAVNSKLSFTTETNGSSVTPLTIYGDTITGRSTVDMQGAGQIWISNPSGTVDLYGNVEFNNGTTTFVAANSVDFLCDVDLNGEVKFAKTTTTGGASSSTATALDVTKTLQVLNSTDSNDDSWTLADGTEGQIMHFVPGSGTGSNQHYIEIANWRRWDSDTSSWIVEQDLTWIPFKMDFDGTTWTGVATAIFTDGAWQTSNPWID